MYIPLDFAAGLVFHAIKRLLRERHPSRRNANRSWISPPMTKTSSAAQQVAGLIDTQKQGICCPVVFVEGKAGCGRRDPELIVFARYMLDRFAFCVLVRHTTRGCQERCEKKKKGRERTRRRGRDFPFFFVWPHVDERVSIPRRRPVRSHKLRCVSASSAVMVLRHRLFCNLSRDLTGQRPSHLPTFRSNPKP